MSPGGITEYIHSKINYCFQDAIVEILAAEVFPILKQKHQWRIKLFKTVIANCDFLKHELMSS